MKHYHNIVYFSPIFGEIEPKEIVEFLQEEDLYNEYTPVRVQLQLHKFIWPPEPRGVYNDSVSTTTVNSVIQPNQMQQDMNDIKNDLIYTLTNNSSINTQSNNSEPVAVVNDNTVKESDNKQPIIMNTLKLKTSKLNEFLSNGAKRSNNNPKQPLSQVIQLKFSDKGFEVISGDGINVLSQKDETVRFTQDISIGISNDVFINFIY